MAANSPLQFVKLPHCAGFGKAHDGDAGYDLYASFQDKESFFLEPRFREKIPTGVKVACPPNMVYFVKPRSGLAWHKGIDVLAGVIDSSYRGEVKVILVNHDGRKTLIKHGDRIAQLVPLLLAPFPMEEVNVLPATDRGEKGFGSSGK